MQIVYANQPFPNSWDKAIFLAGPTPRSDEVPSWRPTALRMLQDLGYDGVVFVPEDEDGLWRHSYDDQVEWERQGLNFADVIVFWVPRELEKMPAFTTNVEFGRWITSGKVDLGRPPKAPKMRYLDWLIDHESDGHEKPHDTLAGALIEAVRRVGPGAVRTGGERGVPLQIWNTPIFQGWYDALKSAGNRLDEAEQRWVFRMPKLQKVFCWVLWVKVWISKEERWKDNEWVFARSDISTVVLWYRGSNKGVLTEELLDTKVVMVKEFRSPGRTSDGFVHELPGGSSTDPDSNPLDTAAAEVEEETGLKIARVKTAYRKLAGLRIANKRFKMVKTRQVAATLSAHQAFCFTARLNASELREVHQMIKDGVTHGNKEDTELTYLEVVTLGEMLKGDLHDWATVGMVAEAVLEDRLS